MGVPATTTRASSTGLRTVGDIARDLGVPYYRIRYALQTCETIKPVRKIANYLVFDDAGVELIRQRLTEIASRSKKAA